MLNKRAGYEVKGKLVGSLFYLDELKLFSRDRVTAGGDYCKKHLTTHERPHWKKVAETIL